MPLKSHWVFRGGANELSQGKKPIKELHLPNEVYLNNSIELRKPIS
jgi:hypothetical protein